MGYQLGRQFSSREPPAASFWAGFDFLLSQLGRWLEEKHPRWEAVSPFMTQPQQSVSITCDSLPFMELIIKFHPGWRRGTQTPPVYGRCHGSRKRQDHRNIVVGILGGNKICHTPDSNVPVPSLMPHSPPYSSPSSGLALPL